MGQKNVQVNPEDLSITQQPTTTSTLEAFEGEWKNVEGADPALEFAGNEVIEFTEEEEVNLLKKIDWHILPLLCWVYLIQFAEKTTLNYASLMGIREDTHLNNASQQYSWASSIFYAGYILWE